MHTGKLHPKNVGPYLVLEKTGPVTYKIQESEGARESIMHVDKLYPFHPEEDQTMVSWLPPEIPQINVACQCTGADFDSICNTNPEDVQDVTQSGEIVISSQEAAQVSYGSAQPRLHANDNRNILPQVDEIVPPDQCAPKVPPKDNAKSPRGLTKSPREAANSPPRRTKSPRGSAKSPHEVTKSPPGRAKSPRGLAKSPCEVTKSPPERTKSPPGIAKSPRPRMSPRGPTAKSPPPAEIVKTHDTESARTTEFPHSITDMIPTTTYLKEDDRTTVDDNIDISIIPTNQSQTSNIQPRRPKRDRRKPARFRRLKIIKPTLSTLCPYKYDVRNNKFNYTR